MTSTQKRWHRGPGGVSVPGFALLICAFALLLFPGAGAAQGVGGGGGSRTGRIEGQIVGADGYPIAGTIITASTWIFLDIVHKLCRAS